MMYDTRGSSSRFQLPLPKANYGKKRFGHRGPFIWNKLPKNLPAWMQASMNLYKTKLDRSVPSFFDSIL